MDKVIMKAVLFFCRLFVRKGVDFEKLKVIAETKVMMDRRRVYVNWRTRQQKENKNPLLGTLIIYTLFGAFIGLTVFTFESHLLVMILLHSYLLFMMAMTMVTDFSTVLLDTTDNQVILPKPVNSRTLFMARLVHILVYLLQFTVVLSAFPLLFVFVKYGLLVGLCTIATFLLTVAFAVFLTYLLYALILRFSTEQKIKDIVGYFQIFMTVFFAVGFQILPRVIDFDNISANFQLHWYSYLLPPVWMAMALEAAETANFDWLHLGMLASAITIPVATFWLMINYLAPSFARKLAALSTGDSGQPKTASENTHRRSISEKLSAFVCRGTNERAAFEFVWKVTSRDKAFKMQFYPSLAYMLVFVFVFAFKSGKGMEQLWRDLPSTNMFLFFVYLPVFSVSSAVTFITYHENFQASWIYQATPVATPGHLISGGIKALMVKFFMPVYLLFFAFGIYVWGWAIIDDFALGFFNNAIIFLLFATINEHYLPFSRQLNAKQQSGRFMQVLLSLLIVGALVAIHYFILRYDWLTYLFIVLSMIGAFFLLRGIRRLHWLEISF